VALQTPLGHRGCEIFTVQDDRITFQRGYRVSPSFLRMHKLPFEEQPLSTIFELIGGFGRCGIGARHNYAE
jgi:hypothetical protein